MKPKIAIIGAGGRTGTMFSFELQKAAEVIGVGREKEIKNIKEGRFFVERNSQTSQFFEGKVLSDFEFQAEKFSADIIFLTTKNPVSLPIEFYYQGFEEKIPTLLISQNGIAAIEEAQKKIEEIFNQGSEKVRIVRIILFNSIDREEKKGKIYIKYSLPLRAALAKVSGPGGVEDILKIFKDAGFETAEFPEKEAKNLEFSKLFLNLIGMRAAAEGMTVAEGLSNKEIFKEEIQALKEYKKVVRAAQGKFLNFPKYPIKNLAFFVEWLPLIFWLPLRNIFAKIISQGRNGKEKDLDEIEYYNGAVVELGKKFKIPTPINEKILNKAREKLALGHNH